MTENQDSNFEAELRRQLRPVEPSAGFTDRLMAALPAQQKPVVVPFTPRAVHRSSARRFGMPVALAASLLVAVFLGMQMANYRDAIEQEKGMAASKELMQALRVTSQKLDLAFEAVNSPPSAEDEENRS